MTRELIDEIRSMGADFYFFDGIEMSVTPVFPSVFDCLKYDGRLIELDREFDSDHMIACSMPKSVIIRKKGVRLATDEELLAF